MISAASEENQNQTIFNLRKDLLACVTEKFRPDIRNGWILELIIRPDLASLFPLCLPTLLLLFCLPICFSLHLFFFF